MATERLEFEAPNHAKLYRWAQAQGLDVAYHTPFPELLAQIRAAYPPLQDATFVEIEAEDEAPVPSVVAVSANGLRHPELPAWHYKNDPLVRISVSTNDDVGGNKQPLPICVNGDHILIQRNTEVDIPYRHYLALCDAKQTDFREEKGPNGETVLIGEDRYAITFNTVGGLPTTGEIAAWRERTKDIGREKKEDPSLKSDQALDLLAGKLLGKLQAAAA